MAPIDPLLSANPWDDSGSDGGSGSGVPSSVPPPPPRPLVRVMVVVSAGAAAMLLLLLLWAYRRRHRRLPSGDSGLNAELLGVASPRVDTAPAGWTLKRLALLAVAAFVASLELTGTLLIVAVGHQKLEEFAAWLPHQTGWGSLIFLGVWVVAMLCCSPSTPLWLIGGYCFRHDFRKALALNMAGCWLSDVVCFSLARGLRAYCCSSEARRCRRCCNFGDSRALLVLNGLVARNEWRATLLSRLAYAPMPVKNYGFGGFSTVSWRCFFVCSLLGDAPNTALFTHLGGQVTDLAAAVEHKQSMGTSQKVGLSMSILLTCGLLVMLGCHLRVIVVTIRTTLDRLRFT